MKRQPLYKYDSTLLGLNNQYTPIGDDAFFINSSQIIAKDHTLITGVTFLVLKANHEKIIVQPAKLIDVYHDGICVNLLMEDLGTGMCFTIELYFNNKNHQCPWTLIDLTFVKNAVERQAILSYCNSK
jgi:hypothetical protein